MNTATSTAGAKRLDILDLARGAFILLMLIAHGIVFFNRNQAPYLWAVDQVIDIITFVGLLFISGAATGYAYLQRKFTRNDWHVKQQHIAKKFILMLIGYYLIGIIINLANLKVWDSDAVITTFAKVILFMNVPEFAEFLIPFLVYYLVTLFLRRPLRIIANNRLLLWGVIIVCFGWGTAISQLDVSFGDFEFIRQILVGSKDVYRFPILQYFPVFLLGAHWATQQDWEIRQVFTKKIRWFLASLVAIIVVIAAGFLSTGKLSFNPLRWPPNAEFLTLSLSLTFLLILFLDFLLLSNFHKLTTPLKHIGQSAFLYYFYHIAILYLFRALFGLNFAVDPVLTIALIAALIIACVLLVRAFHSYNIINRLLHKLSPLLQPLFILASFACVIYAGYHYLNPKPKPEEVHAVQTVIAEKDFTIDTTISRKWILKDSTQPADYTSAGFNATVTSGTSYNYVAFILDGKVKSTLQHSATQQYELKIAAADLNPGEHTVQLRIEDSSVQSQPLTFNVSYPLYVTWTLDDEGLDISKDNMTAFTKTSDTYKMPMTILVNPRLYVVNDVSKTKQNEILTWLMEQYQDHNAEIGLHMHMRCSMLNAAKLPFPVRTEPRWGGRADCHDVVNFAYPYDEYDAIIKWALKLFEEKGLPRPITYRAGGWFMGLDNLKVIEANGFRIDTSGKEAYTWGSNNLQSTWSLPITSKPFIPAWNNQNQKGTAGNTFSTLWEFPNNGSDTTNNPYELVKKRFDMNFTGKPLTSPQTLTFMSHMQWYTTIDEPKLEKLLKNISVYKIDNDSGPVIFSTLQSSYQYWKTTNNVY